MKPITLFFALLLAVAGFGAGILVGRQGSKPSSTPAEVLPNPNFSTSDADKLPAIKLKSRLVAGANNGPRMSLAEVETAFNELKSLSRSKLSERINEISKAVDSEDIPQVLVLAAKLPVDLQRGLRYALLPRWAETDPRSAMDYASGLKDFNERHQTILSVLRGWAKNDP